MVDYIEAFLTELGLSTDPADNLIVFGGHSRGGAVVNIAAVYGMKTGKYLLDQTFIYTFATPNTTTNQDYSYYPNIFNIVNSSDPVTRVPPYAWRYGISMGYGFGEVGQIIDTVRRTLAPLDLGSISSLIHHSSDIYMLLVGAMEPTVAWMGVGLEFVYIDCPTDVRVYCDDQLVVLIENGIVDRSITDPNIIALTVGYSKRLILPDDRVYRIVITATGNDHMDYRVEHVSGDSAKTESVALVSEVDIPLQIDDVFEAYIYAGPSASGVTKIANEQDDNLQDNTANGSWFDKMRSSLSTSNALLAAVLVAGLSVGIALGNGVSRRKQKNQK